VNKWTIMIVFISLLQFGFGTATEAAGTSVQKSAETAGIDLARTVKALRQIRTDSSDTTIPPAARPLLTTLKHQLRDLIYRVLTSHGGHSNNLADVQKALLTELQKQGITFKKPKTVVVGKDYVDPGYTYGNIYQVTVEKLARHPDLMAATTTIGVCCGTDTSLYIFKKKDQQWVMIIAQEANNYQEVSGAQGSFQYVISPPSATGQFFLVTTKVNPWCTSNWQSIRYRVFRVGPTPYQPRILLERTESIYLGNEDHGNITSLPNGFRIEFDAGQQLDVGVLIRKHVVTYQVEGDRVWRVPPLALEPEGFLDEWFRLEWKEASKWIEPSASADLRRWHQRFRLDPLTGDIRFLTNFVFDPPACRVKKQEWQVGIEFSPYKEGGSLPIGMPKAAYFTIILKDGAYFLKSVSASSLPKCNSK